MSGDQDKKTLEPNQEAFWKGYLFSLKNFVFPEPSDTQLFFAAPQSTVGLLAGQFVPEPVTNYGIYKWGDGLLSPNQPIYLGTGIGSYVLSLQQYLSYVDIGGDPSEGAYTAYIKAVQDSVAAKQVYLKDLKDAAQVYKDTQGNNFPTLEQWARENYPSLLENKEAWTSAVGKEMALREQVYGPEAGELNTAVQGLLTALSDGSQPGLNMPVTMNNVELSAGDSLLAAKGEKITYPPFTTTYSPLYGIEGQFQGQIEDWSSAYTAGDLKPTTIAIEVGKYASSDWEQVGMRTIEGGGYGGLFFGIEASYSRKDEWDKTFNSMTADDFQCELQIYGTKTFPLTTGGWDIPNVTETFPKLRPDAPEDMMDLIQPKAVVMAYTVGMTVKFSDKYSDAFASHWKTVEKAEAGLCIFGIDIGLGGSWNQTTETNSHKAHFNSNTGTLTVEPNNDGRSVLLGMIGEKLRP